MKYEVQLHSMGSMEKMVILHIFVVLSCDPAFANVPWHSRAEGLQAFHLAYVCVPHQRELLLWVEYKFPFKKKNFSNL